MNPDRRNPNDRMSSDEGKRQLERALAELYGAPLEEFIRRRDALAKELRAARDRDSADVVKALRKPGRIAWALNSAVLGNGNVIAGLDGAIAGTIAAQTSGGDVRAAMAALREAVRHVALEAAGAAERAGHRVETSALSTAVLAVLGRPESLAQLRDGRLVDVPDAGGLDFLSTLPAPVDPVPEAVAISEAHRPDGSEAQERAVAAAAALAEARARAESAHEILRAVELEHDTARERLRIIEQELEAAQERSAAARRQAEAMDAELRRAEAVNDEAQRELGAVPDDA